jgi:hypothetical protein
MNASVSMSDLFRTLLPPDHSKGWLTMLRAYFDDSGTHDASDVVLVAGLFGTEGHLDGLDRSWIKHIERPLDGAKAPLTRFHMADCQASTGEFAGWSRTETDYFCHQLRVAIINSGVSAYCSACIRKAFDEFVTGDLRAILGNAEVFCIRNCFNHTVTWAKENTFDPKMAFIFDNRPSLVQRDAKVAFHVFQILTPQPNIVDVAFLSSYDIRPLQAADMLAWEFYQHVNSIFLKGSNESQREQFTHLTSNMALVCQIATPCNDALHRSLGAIPCGCWRA